LPDIDSTATSKALERREELTMRGSIPISTSRTMVDAASLVWRVEGRRWPVSAASTTQAEATIGS
jgi:hypothetical protein